MLWIRPNCIYVQPQDNHLWKKNWTYGNFKLAQGVGKGNLWSTRIWARFRPSYNFNLDCTNYFCLGVTVTTHYRNTLWLSWVRFLLQTWRTCAPEESSAFCCIAQVRACSVVLVYTSYSGTLPVISQLGACIPRGGSGLVQRHEALQGVSPRSEVGIQACSFGNTTLVPIPQFIESWPGLLKVLLLLEAYL